MCVVYELLDLIDDAEAYTNFSGEVLLMSEIKGGRQ